MAYILKKQPSAAAGSRWLAALIALLGLVLTTSQIGYIFKTGSALCLNGGCAVVESLTRLPPIFFNMAGAFFFLVLLICNQLAENDYGARNFWSRAASLALLVAMAMEGVLVSFQSQVLQVWCAYCLIIFACVFLLNLSFGGRQFLLGMAVFAAVVAASLSLNYTSPWDVSGGQRGSYGEIVRPHAAIKARLYFSAACPHCEEVIASLNEDVSCQIGFYPLDTVPELSVAGLKKNPHYDSAVNRALLQGLGLGEVPALVAREGEEIRVVIGKDAILAFLERCRPAPISSGLFSQGQFSTPINARNGQSRIVDSAENTAEESCPVGVACPPEAVALPPARR